MSETVLGRTGNKSNKLWVTIGFIIIGLIVIAKMDIESCDTYFMVKHGEDILQNGFYREYDTFSMHDGLEFMSQKWATCVITYLLYTMSGMTGIRIASNVLTFGLFCLMYVTLNKLSPNTKNVNILVAVPMFCGMLEYAVFRPHLIAAYFLFYELICFEKYVRGEMKQKALYIQLFCISLCTMWFHSTMWYMCIVFAMPYLLDIKYIADGIQTNEYPIIKNVKHVSYDKKPLLIGVIMMLIASLLQPYGLEQYKYMFVCLTATGEKYSHISELHPLSLTSPMSHCLFLIIAIIAFIAVKYKSIQLRCVYMFVGGLLLAGMANRLFFFSMLLYVIVIGNALGKGITDEVKDQLNKKTSNIVTIITNTSVIIACIVWVISIGYFTVESNFISQYHKGKGFYAVDVLINNISDTDDVTVFSDVDVGSYMIVRGLHPYIDCRAEVYDIRVNNEKDILNEYHYLLLGEYNGQSLEDASVVQQFMDTYNFDYYILIKDVGRYDLEIRHMYEVIEEELYCNYEDEYYAIYSASDFRQFEYN